MNSERRPDTQRFEHEKYVLLRAKISTVIGPLSEEFISKVRTDLLVPHADKALAVFADVPGVEKDLTDIKQDMEEKHSKPSSPRIAANLLDSSASEFIERLADPILAGNLQMQNLMQFLIFYDYAMGIKYAANTILFAESILRGASMFDAIDNLHDSVKPTDPVVVVEVALIADGRNRQAASILDKHPAGHEVIQFAVQTLENDPSLLPPFVIQGFNIEGGRYAQSAYGIIYPIAERINKK